MKYLISILIVLCIPYRSYSQTLTWEKQFHFDYFTGASSAFETEDSGFFVFGAIGDTINSAPWLFKLTKFGDVSWKKKMNPNIDLISTVIKRPGIYLSVDNQNVYDSSTKAWVGHYNLSEINIADDTVWSEVYNVNHSIYFPDQILSLNTGSYIIDADYSGANSTTQLLVQKFSSNHNLVWSDTIKHGMNTDQGKLFKTRNNKILIGGEGGNGGLNNRFLFLELLDSNGKQLNYVAFPYISDSSEEIDYMQQLADGNIVVESTDNGNPAYFTLADSVGNILKRLDFGSTPNPDAIGGFVPNGDSIITFSGSESLVGPLALDNYDTNFHSVWVKSYDDTASFQNNPIQILKTSDGGLLLLGIREWDGGPNLNGPTDMVVIKLNADGKLAKKDYSGILAQSASSNISIYPNPALDNLYINTQNTNFVLKLEIFDSRGAMVISLPELSPGNERINVSYLNKGLYMYRLNNDAGVYSTGKFVKE